MTVALLQLGLIGDSAFQHRAGTGRVRTRVAGGLAGSSARGASSARRRPKARTRALPEFLFGVEVASLPSHFLVALIPAIIAEVTLAKPVQKKLAELGYASAQNLLPGFDESVSVERAFNPIGEAARNKLSKVMPPMSTLMKRTHAPVLALNLVSAAVLFYDTYMIPQGYRSVALPIEPFVASALALGFFLTQRLSQASERFNLAKGLLGDMLNVSRELAQQASQWASSREAFVDYARWLPAFMASLICQLNESSDEDLAKELRAAAGQEDTAVRLSEEDVQMVMERPEGWSAPQYILFMLREKTKHLGLDEQQRLLMEANTSRLTNGLGACLELADSPLPSSSSEQIPKFLLGWLSLLPFALESKLGLWTVFAEQILATSLLGIQDTGIRLERPFEVLPVRRITSQIALEADVLSNNVAALGEPALQTIMELPEEAEGPASQSPLKIDEVAAPVEITTEAPLFGLSRGTEPEIAPMARGASERTSASQAQHLAGPMGGTNENDLNNAAGVEAWLRTRHLERYFPLFVSEGYDDLVILQNAEDDEVEALIQRCCMLRGHVRHFMRGLQSLREAGAVAFKQHLSLETERRSWGQFVTA